MYFNNIQVFSSKFRTNASIRSFINATIKFNNMFSTDEKNEIKTSQENISPEEVIEKISNECCNGDKQKGKKIYDEAINLIKNKIW